MKGGGYPGRDKKFNPVILISAIAGVIVVAVAAVVIFMVMHGSDGGAAGGGGSNVSIVTPAPTAVPTPIPPPVFANYNASSTRGADYTAGYAIYYYASYAVDGDMTTAWSCDRNVELTPTYTLKSDTKQHVTGVKLTNGYCKSNQTYYKNRRITQIEVSYEGGSQTVNLQEDAYRVMQDIPLNAPVDTSYISIRVLDSIYGDWKDIAISEISVY